MNISQIYIDKKTWYRDAALCVAICYFIPIYLLFHWDKVVLERFSIVLSVCSLICFLILRYRYSFVKDIERLKDFVLCEGHVIDNYHSGGRRTRFQAAIQVRYDGRSYQYLSKFQNHGYAKMTRLWVLLDLKNPNNSITLSEHPYLRLKIK